MSVDTKVGGSLINMALDKHVGSRVRMRRILAGISQEGLGEALGLSFQQVQKYEKGVKHISASCLQQIGKMLDVPVSFFFDGAPTGGTSEPGSADPTMALYISEFLATSEGVHLIKTFNRVKSGRARRRIIDVAEALAEQSDIS